MLTPEQQAYLRTNGISENGFNPPTAPMEATDFYMAHTFDIKVAGYSSFPKLSDVRDRRDAGKPQTKSGSLMLEALEIFEDDCSAVDDPGRLAWLDVMIAASKTILAAQRANIQRAKFAVTLAHRWFDEFSSREGCVIPLHDTKFTFEVNEEKVEY
jgi:hypothetical protein